MLVVEIRPGVFMRLRPEDVKRLGLEAEPEAHKAMTPAAAKKTTKKKAAPVVEEEGDDNGTGDN